MSAPQAVAAVLDRLAAWAADDSAFAQGTMARDRDGAPTDPLGPSACRWCLLARVCMLDLDPVTFDAVLNGALLPAARALGYRNETQANDTGGLPAVRALIARAREEASGD